MLNDSLKTKGELELTLIDEAGNSKHVKVSNLVVNTGLAYIISRMKDDTQSAISHMAIGSGTVAATSTDTGLGSQIERVALDSTTIITTTVSNDSIQYIATFPAGTGTGAITEAGLFNSATAGTMLCRTVFPVINKGALDVLVINWKVTVA